MVHAGCVFAAGIHLSQMFLVGAMECMCAQTTSRFILSSEGVLGNGVRTMLTPRQKAEA